VDAGPEGRKTKTKKTPTTWFPRWLIKERAGKPPTAGTTLDDTATPLLYGTCIVQPLNPDFTQTHRLVGSVQKLVSIQQGLLLLDCIMSNQPATSSYAYRLGVLNFFLLSIRDTHTHAPFGVECHPSSLCRQTGSRRR
jgi:hypothetical protein